MKLLTKFAAAAVAIAGTSSAAPQPHLQTAVLAGGCFWGMEAVFEHVKGVNDVVSGFAGGAAKDASYDKVSSESTRHAEAVRITYDPSRISYAQLLQIYFKVAHDPTQVNRQGPDVGLSYRSAIFYTSQDQKRVAEQTIADVNASGLWPGKVVTEVVPAGDFWQAEPEHQDYLERIPNGYTCHYVRPNWKLGLKKAS